ncbi:glycosyltransferase family 2 protein [Methanolobus chelungpuianus]|uniref:Glycosyltransferase 2-like domain-containing protein n=1 Tax=Methanolobus chelungpuianus TaxID=502115 RepID=A0AAE3KYQ8_9EURY|nr:glycosyltransferase [Methanolobus chelungpuianus]MCQ6962318.1 hypothetical protein [Methanolobus chelungpuianus]
MDKQERIMVSICCITYNHEKYVAKAIEGFLMQETDFKYEVVVHDDASTDHTADIIRSYEQKYPEIIKPIYQTINQHSKGVRVLPTFIYPKATGKYIALCEGDDYWTDPHKLKKQVDHMEQNPGCTFCFHNAFLENDTAGLLKKAMVPHTDQNKKYYSNQNRKYNAGELQLLGFIPTASFLYPKKVVNDLPDWYFDAPAGDLAIKLIATSHGYAYYINEIMSVYRINVQSSMTAQWKKEDRTKKIQRIKGFVSTLDAFDKWTDHRFGNEIEESKTSFELRLELAKGNKRMLSEERYKDYFRKLGSREKINLYIRLYFPRLITFLKETLPFDLKYRLVR